MSKKVNIHIEGIYYYGQGWFNPEENEPLFKEAVTKACERMDLTVTETVVVTKPSFKVQEGRKGATEVYFHPMITVVKGWEDGAEEVARIIKEELEMSPLKIKVTINVL